MLARIVRRISDEEGVKKLTIDTMQSLLFQPAREHNSSRLINKLRVYLLFIITDILKESEYLSLQKIIFCFLFLFLLCEF